MQAQAGLRAGLEGPDRYLANLADTYNAYMRSPGRNRIPIAQFSFVAWIEQYQPARNAPNVAVSYYRKGDLIGVCLDLEIRLRSHEKGTPGSLVGVFRRLMASHGSVGRGIREADIVGAASAEAGEDMAWFFQRYVNGTEALPLTTLLEQVGVQVIEDPEPAPPYTGLELSGTRVRNVEPGSPAAAAGLMRGDELLAVNDRRIGPSDVAGALARDTAKPHRVLVDRHRRVMTLELKPTVSPHRTLSFQRRRDPKVDAKAREVRDGWLLVYGE